MTVFDLLQIKDPSDDPASQERLREIRQLIGEPRAEDAGGGMMASRYYAFPPLPLAQLPLHPCALDLLGIRPLKA